MILFFRALWSMRANTFYCVHAHRESNIPNAHRWDNIMFWRHTDTNWALTVELFSPVQVRLRRDQGSGWEGAPRSLVWVGAGASKPHFQRQPDCYSIPFWWVLSIRARVLHPLLPSVYGKSHHCAALRFFHQTRTMNVGFWQINCN